MMFGFKDLVIVVALMVCDTNSAHATITTIEEVRDSSASSDKFHDTFITNEEQNRRILTNSSLYSSSLTTIEASFLAYEQVGSIFPLAPDNLPNNRYGYSLSISNSGDILVIGSVGVNSNTGQIQIYKYDEGSSDWNLEITIPGDEENHYFGASVSMNKYGNRIAVGGSYEPNPSKSGTARVYALRTSSWVQVGSTITRSVAGDSFGCSIGMNAAGDRVVVGAKSAGNSAGAVSVYQDSAGIWTTIGSELVGISEGIDFGASVDINAAGDVIVIGSPLDRGGFAIGKVWTYKYINDDWTAIGLAIAGTALQDKFGSSVAINDAGDRWIAGSIGFNNSTGVARVYEYSASSNTWTQLGADLVGGNEDDQLGYSVSMDRSGSRVYVGAPSSGSSLDGYVKVYDYNSNVWNERDRIEFGGVSLGESIAITGDGYFLVAGSQSYDNFDGYVVAVADDPLTIPSAHPSTSPSTLPTNLPSDSPSDTPSVSNAPSSSVAPTFGPSIPPTFHPTISLIPSPTPSDVPSVWPSDSPTGLPSGLPSMKPSTKPSFQPSGLPTVTASNTPSALPTSGPSSSPSSLPSPLPSNRPSHSPSDKPSPLPSPSPSAKPSSHPTSLPTTRPSPAPSPSPSAKPSPSPSAKPSARPSASPSAKPSASPSASPSAKPSAKPSFKPSSSPSSSPTSHPTSNPTESPSLSVRPSPRPSSQPSRSPSESPTVTQQPTAKPSATPSKEPSDTPSVSPSVSNAPTKIRYCFDQSDFLVDSNPGQDCAWVGEDKKDRCAKYAGRGGDGRVFEFCRKTCNKCACIDDPDWVGEEKWITCAYVSRIPEKRALRCDVVDGAQEYCKKSCFKCCRDRKNFLYKQEAGKNCAWVGRNKSGRCHRNIIAMNCPTTCGFCNDDDYLNH